MSGPGSACRFCGGVVEAKDPACDFCFFCYYQGRVHAESFEDLLRDLRAVDAIAVDATIEHTGGGSWAMVVHAGARLVVGTVARQDDTGDWYCDSVLPESQNGPWSVGVYASDEAWGEIDPLAFEMPVSGEAFVALVKSVAAGTLPRTCLLCGRAVPLNGTGICLRCERSGKRDA
jgi:hypothetical protein